MTAFLPQKQLAVSGLKALRSANDPSDLARALGERLHTVYLGAPPEYGKEAFYAMMEREIVRYKKRYPRAYWLGVADGAHDQWAWLERWTQAQVLDYWHAAGYLEKAAAGVCWSLVCGLQRDEAASSPRQCDPSGGLSFARVAWRQAGVLELAVGDRGAIGGTERRKNKHN